MTSENSTPASSAIDDIFGENLKQCREQRGLTQEGLNNEMLKRGFEFHPTTIYRIEKGRRRVLIGEAVALAQVLNVPLERLTSPANSSETSLLFQLKEVARDQYEDIFQAIGYLESKLTTSEALTALLGHLEEPNKKHDFGGVQATAQDFYRPAIEADLRPALKSLKDITKKAEKLSGYLFK